MSKTKQAHLDYWRARSEAIFRYVDQTDLDVLAELSKIYAEQAVVMQKELYQFVMSYAENGQMSYQEALERLRKVDLSDYQVNAKRYFEQAKNAKDPELLKRLNEQYVSARASRMDLLHLEMTYRLGSLNQVLQGTFESYLKKTAKYAYRKAMAGSASLDESLLKTLVETPFDGRNYSKQLWDNTDKLVEDLKDVLKRGFIRGDSVKTMAQEIAGKYNIARSRAQTLIRTDGTAIINRAAIQRYKDAGLTYYRDSVHLDDRTTAICREVAKKDELKRIDEMVIGVNAAPYHYNCRTAVIPEVDVSDERLDNTGDKVYNQDMLTIDLMAKQRSFTVGNVIRVKTKKLNATDFDFWVQDNTKRIRDTVFNVQSVFRELKDYHKPTVVFLKKSRLPGFAGYDYRQDILFVSDALHSEKGFAKVLSDNYFAAQNIKDTMVHELTHKKHWDSAKAFYKANKKRYNSVEQAMSGLNSPLVSYVKEQLIHDFNYLVKVSPNADDAFILGNVNELVAEVAILGDKTPDLELYKKVQEVLSWK